MAKSKADLEKEYQDALKISSSMVGDLTKLIEANTNATKKKTSAEQGYQKSLKQMLDDSDNAASIQERIAIIEAQKEKISKNYFGKNKQIGELMIANLNVQQNQLKAVDMVDKKAQNLSESLGSGLDSLHSKLGSIPVLGGLLQKVTSGPLESMKGAISDSAKRFVVGFSEAAKGGSKGIMSFVKSSIGGFRAMGVAMLTGPQAVIFGLLAVIAAGIAAFAKMEAGAKAFRDETGLLNSQTQQMETNINKVFTATASLGASMEDVAKAAADFTNEFGGIEQPAEGTMKSMIVLSKNFGVSTQDAAKLNKTFQNMGGLSEAAAQSQVMFTAELAKAAGVAPNKVMADIAESANDAGGFFRGNTKEMIKQATFARAMGSSLKEVAAVSRQLLNYQDSVTNEMEASAILGTNLNFSQSRYLAAQGDILGAQKSMVEQLRNTVDLENASIYEREALEKATGMQFDQIQNMARIQERFGDLDEERLGAAQSLLKQGKDLSKLTDADLAKETERLAKQQEMQGELESIGNQFSAFGSELLQMFLPIGKVIVGALGGIIPIFKGIFGTIGRAVQGVMDAFSDIGSVFKEIFGGSEASDFSGVLETIGSILGGTIAFGINLMSNGLKMVAAIFKGLFTFVKGLITLDFGMMADGFMSVVEGIFRYFKAIPAALIDTILDIFPGLGEAFSQFWESVKQKALGIFQSIKSSITSFLPDFITGGDKVEEAGSVQDGVIQNGKIISTDPSDTIIAAKNPMEALFGGLSSIGDTIRGGISNVASAGGGIIDNLTGSTDREMLSKLEEIRLAVLQNKDVYMDNQKVTSNVTKTQEKSSINQFGLMGA